MTNSQFQSLFGKTDWILSVSYQKDELLQNCQDLSPVSPNTFSFRYEQCSSAPHPHHPFHVNSKYTFCRSCNLSPKHQISEWYIYVQAVQYGHSTPQDTQMTTSEGALDIMGLQRPKQKDMTLLFLITIFTIEQHNVK